uniref:alpha-L-rhamnosidase n=1 Tax=Psilocybe cubensis TaxID=181762 RepID=A0A8H8CEE4_PSICU
MRSHTDFVLSLSLLWVCNALAGPTLSSLTVENRVEPLGIDVNPRFSWIISSSMDNDAQKSYRLRVSSGTTPTDSELWDTGTISSTRSYLVEYGGPALASDTQYSWTVEVTTASGSTSASSLFSTGLLTNNDWGSSLWIGKQAQADSPPADLVSSFLNSSWIWTSEANPPNAPPGDRAFRRTYVPPPGRRAVSAEILITADNQFTIYADGKFVGPSHTALNWQNAQYFTIPLSSSSPSFAVRATNLADPGTGGDGPAGLLVSIKVHLDNGNADFVTTDSSWLSDKSIPDDWNAINASTTGWDPASILSPYGQGPWSNHVVTPASITAPVLTFAQSNWIWSSEVDPLLAPPGTRAFRKTFTAPSGKTLQSATILITVDNDFKLYVNGGLIGVSPNDTDWTSAQKFIVNLTGSSVVFAVLANNQPDKTSGGPNPAGLLSAIQIAFTDTSTQAIVSDNSWRVDATVPSGFELPSTDDSSWPSATSIGLYGIGPWGTGIKVSESLTEHPAPLLRKEFTVSKPISFARLYYAAGGYASITINGVPASDHVLTPGFTKYDTELQYVALNVSSLLKGGTNAIGTELGRGHYGVTQGSVWNWDSAPWHGEPRVRMVLSIGFTDGTLSRVVTDDTWQVIEGPTRLDDIFGGEIFDASYIQEGYDLPGFEAKGWGQAAIMTAPFGVLINQNQPPTRVVQSLTPIDITQPQPGIFVAHYERVVSGWVRFTASGPTKTLIILHFGEKLNTDGTVVYQDTQQYYANNFQTDRFWLAGKGTPETFEPKFSYKGYQYVQIEGWPSGTPPPAPENVIGRVVHDDLTPRGGFQSSSDLLNKMHTAAVFTLLNNVHSIPTDCPTFEKNGWTGDAMLGTEMFLLNLDSQDLLSKYVRDIDESRSKGSGAPAVVVPDSGWGANNQAPTWHSAFILIPWWIYQYRGDQRILANHYDSMKNYVNFELGRSSNNIAQTTLGDWDTPETSPLGGNPPEDSRVSATAFLYKMLTVMSEIASVLKKDSDSSTFSNQAQDVKTAFNNAFLNPNTGYYTGVGDSGYRQTHNILALAFGLAPNASIQKVADSISQNISSIGTHLNTGALGTKFLLPVLTDFGHGDTAFAVSQQTTFPSWGYWIQNGATTMWEHWLLTARSRDHLFLGTFEDWLYKHVAGIQAMSPAFETVKFLRYYLHL